MISGNTVVNEGGTLILDCDVTNSVPLPNVQWFNPAGQIVAVDTELIIENIQRSQSGTYTCVALQSGIDMTSTVDVTVQCKCVCTCAFV